MTKGTMRKYSLMGLVLLVASAVTAAVLPKDEVKKQVGGLEETTDGGQQTCTANGGVGACTYTATGAGSATTTDNDGSSSITDGLERVRTITSGDGVHTSFH